MSTLFVRDVVLVTKNFPLISGAVETTYFMKLEASKNIIVKFSSLAVSCSLRCCFSPYYSPCQSQFSLTILLEALPYWKKKTPVIQGDEKRKTPSVSTSSNYYYALSLPFHPTNFMCEDGKIIIIITLSD